MREKPRRAAKQRLVAIGDVLKTHPMDGYWGCALVLSARDKTGQFDPMSHIGITSLVFTHDYAFHELDLKGLEILEDDVSIRVGPGSYAHWRRSLCIGIYSRRITPAVHVIGNLDVASLVPAPLTFEAGDGTDGGWPFCGRVEESLGYEAVHAWRSVHDRTQWLSDIAAAEKSHEEMLVRLKEEDRQKRKNAKARKKA